ncbi:MAG: HAD family hydrolase [Flavobacteriales bacterium]
MQGPYKAILFDLGGVLIDIDYHATERAFIELGVHDFAVRYTQFAQEDLFDLFETGQISPQHFINKLLPITTPGTSPNQVYAAWNAMLGNFPKEKIDFLQQISKEFPIFMLSNTNAIHWEIVLQRWKNVCEAPLESVFDHIFLSHEIKQRKPHSSTFGWVLEQMQLTADQVLFIDDSPQHVEGARIAGLDAVLYDPKKSLNFYFS